MQESSSNEHRGIFNREIYIKNSVPLKASFFVRLDGWNFRKLSQTLDVEKPFDENFAKCLVYSGKTIFDMGFAPALIYFASDELNMLFLGDIPFRGRIEKIDSVMPSLISTAFTLYVHKLFDKNIIAAFDSRIILVSNEKEIIKYLAWRQACAWRNHNNAYAYWVYRKTGYKPSEIAKILKGMKTEEINETLFGRGYNLEDTPLWQRRGILLYKQPYSKRMADKAVIRWVISENWNLPPFSSDEGAKLIQQILEWVKQKRRS